MKRGEPFNVLRDRNSWSENPRAEAIAFSLFGGGFATSAAFAASTVGMFAIAGVSVGLSLVTSWAVAALTPMPPTPKQSILVNGRDAAAPQDFIYGTVRKGGTITYYESTRGGSVLHQIIALAGHEVDDIVEVYANDEVLELSNEDYDFNGRTGAGWVLNRNWIDKDDGPELRVLYHTGSQTAITDPFANATTTSLNDTLFEDSDEGSANFGGTGQPTKESFVGTGIAYLYIRYSYNAGVFKNGLPLFTAKIKGRPVYDPRTDTTAWSDNAALCIRDFIANAYGLGDPQVDDTAFGVAANICDETVTLAAGGTEKRYTINGVVRADQSYGDVLQEMTTACAGTLFWGTGKWKLHVGAYSAPVKDFTLNDIRSTSISLQTRVNLRDQFNKVQGVFTDAGSDYIPVDYPPIESATFKAQDNNVEQVLDLDLPFTTSAAAAQRLAKLTLFRGREQMSFTADFGLSAFEVEVGDIIALTMSRYGWEAKEFEVVGWVFGAGDAGALRISLTLRETSEAAFDWDAEESDIISNDSDLTSDVNPVTNLTATAGGTIAQDGTFINSILVDWDAANNATGYDIEWMVNTSVDYAANGGIVEPADAVTPREQFIYKAYVEILYRQPDGDGFDFYNTGGGSSLTEEEIRAQLFESSERTALAFSGSSVRNPTTEFTITPVRDETEYNIRVRAFNDLGDRSEWTSVTFTSVTDTTAPSAPTSFTAAGDLGFIRLAWVNPADLDFKHVEVWESPSSSFGSATLLDEVSGNTHVRGNLAPLTTRYYWIRAVDKTGNQSAFVGPRNATTRQITPDDIGPAVVSYENLDATAQGIIEAIEGDLSDFLNGYTGNIDQLTLADLSTVGGEIAGTYATTATLTSNYYTAANTDSAISAAITSFESTFIGDNDLVTNATLTANYYTKTSTDSAISAALTTFESTFIGDNDLLTTAAADVAYYTKAATDSVVSSAITTLEGEIGSTYATLSQTAIIQGDVNSIEAKWGVDVDINGVASGFQLLSGASTSAFNIRANQFNVFPPTGGTGGTEVFSVFTTSTTINGVTYPAGTYVDNALYAEALSVGTTSQGLQVNADSKPNAVYAYQNSLSVYGLFAKNTAFGGGTMEVTSNGGFTGQFLNSSFSAGSFGPFVAVNAQNTGSGGGHGQVGVSLAGGGYAFRAVDGGFYDVSGDGYNPFTGRHDGMILKDVPYVLGDIVVDKRVIVAGLSDSFTEVALASYRNQPGAIGVVAKVLDEWYVPAAFVDIEASRLAQEGHVSAPDDPMAPLVTTHDVADYHNDYDMVNINAVGEGSINVCGENGSIAVGDLIVTSSIPGKGMKQTDDVVRSYTVAKAREAVTFDSPGDIKRVACIYLCG